MQILICVNYKFFTLFSCFFLHPFPCICLLFMTIFRIKSIFIFNLIIHSYFLSNIFILLSPYYLVSKYYSSYQKSFKNISKFLPSFHNFFSSLNVFIFYNNFFQKYFLALKKMSTAVMHKKFLIKN